MSMGASRACGGRTVEVMSDEQTSQTYLMPPSVPRVPVFFLMTPIAPTRGGEGAMHVTRPLSRMRGRVRWVGVAGRERLGENGWDGR